MSLSGDPRHVRARAKLQSVRPVHRHRGGLIDFDRVGTGRGTSYGDGRQRVDEGMHLVVERNEVDASSDGSITRNFWLTLAEAGCVAARARPPMSSIRGAEAHSRCNELHRRLQLAREEFP